MKIKELAEYNALKVEGVGIAAPETIEVKKKKEKAWKKAIFKAEKEAKVKLEEMKRRSKKSRVD